MCDHTVVHYGHVRLAWRRECSRLKLEVAELQLRDSGHLLLPLLLSSTHLSLHESPLF